MRYLHLVVALLFLHFTANAQYTINTNGQKNVLLESATGAWTGWAPDGFVYADDVMTTYPNTICIRHHKLDGMVSNQSTAILAAYNVQGYPTGAIDRVKLSGQPGVFASRATWKSTTAAQLQNALSFDIELAYSYNASTRVVTATVKGTALKNLNGQYATNLFIIEDNVTGAGSQFDQRNFSNNTTGHPYFGKGDPLTGFKHMNVVRDALGGVYGDQVFNNPTTNTSQSKSYTYTIPTGYDPNNIRLVATVLKYSPANVNDCEVQNALATPASITKSPCSYPQQTVQICVVTVDTNTGKNLVVWEKGGVKHAKEYKIYRETGNPGNYQHIGTNAANVFSTYLDNGSNPQAKSYKYKITVVDSCNGEMPLASAQAHQTVHVSFNVLMNNNVNISWQPYVGQPYSTYTIKRSNNNGPYVQIAQVNSSITSYNDANPPSGSNKYRVEIVVPGGCSPSAKSTAYNVIISNAAVAWPTGVQNVYTDVINVSPNPANDFVTIEGLPTGAYSVSVYNTLGQLMIDKKLDGVYRLNTAGLPTGVYVIKVVDEEQDAQYISRFQKL